MNFKIGVIGLGIMGQRMMNGMAHHPSFQVTDIWDLNTSASKKFPDLIFHPNAQSLIESDIDAVYIATPPLSHIEYSRLALHANKAIFCEKPLAVDIKASQQLVDEVNASGLPNAINFPFASTPGVATLERLLKENTHGEIEQIDIRFHFSQWPRFWQQDAASWLSGRVQGGFLREVFSHFAYLTHRLIGECEIESKHLIYPKNSSQSENYILAQLNSGGIPISLNGGVGGAAPDYNEWTLYGSKKSYRFQDWAELKVGDEQRWYDVMPDVKESAPLEFQLNALVKTLEGTPALPSFEDGLKVQHLVENLLH